MSLNPYTAAQQGISLTHDRVQDLASRAPAFNLRDATTGKLVSDADLGAGPALVVAFICNHCPFVLHILDDFVYFAEEYQARGAAVVAICSNDVVAHPEDGPGKMAELAVRRGFTFPYLHDADQSVALAYGAICTPEFFVFDGARRLAYRGQFDSARPATEHSAGAVAAVMGADLREACDAVLFGRAMVSPQVPSRGCTIKWTDANQPDWRAG